jgi:hypothetical protein
MYNQRKLFVIVAVSLCAFITEAAPYYSRDFFWNDEGFLVPRERRSMVSDLQQRAVCKFDVESEIDADSRIKYENVKCIEEAFGNCEQLETWLTLPSGRTLTIKTACVFVNKTVSSQLAESKDKRPRVM